MAWVRLDDAIFDDDWFTGLTEAERYCWLALICYSGRNRGVLKTTNPKILSQRIWSSQEIVTSVLKKAKDAFKLEDIGGGEIEIANFSKYNPDPKNSERQKAYRERQKITKVTESNSYEPLHNESNTTLRYDNDTITIHNDNDKPPNPPKGEECVLSESETDVLFKWNQLSEQFPKIPKVLKLSEIRKGHVKQRLAESEFELDKILSGIRCSPFLTGQTNGFKVTFDWVFSSKNNYLKVLEGNYGNTTNGNGHKSPIVAKLEERSRAKL